MYKLSGEKKIWSWTDSKKYHVHDLVGSYLIFERITDQAGLDRLEGQQIIYRESGPGQFKGSKEAGLL